MSEPQSLLRGMLLASAWFALCRALGLAKNIWFAALFGLSAHMDTYLFALGIALLVAALSSRWLVEVSVVYLAKTRSELGQEACLRRAAALAWLSLGFGSAAAAAVWLAAPMLSELAVGFDAARRDAVAQGLLLLLPVVGLAGINGIMSATLRAMRRFSVDSQSEFVSSLVALLALWLWRDHPHILFFAMSASVAAKVFWQSLWVLPMLLPHRPSMAGTLVFFRRYLLLLVQSTIPLGMAAASNAIISHLPTGGIAALHFSAIFFAASLGMLNANIGLNTVISEQRGRDVRALNKVWNDSVSLAIAYTVPLIAFAAFHGEALISLVLEYGAFDASSSELVGQLLVLQLALVLCTRITSSLNIVMKNRAIIAPMLVTVSAAMTIGLATRALLVLGLDWGAHGALTATIIQLSVLAAANSWALNRRGIRLAVAAHARWMAWAAMCSVFAAAPLWLLTQAWPLPKIGVAPIGAAYLAGFAALLWQYRGPEKALLQSYSHRLASSARAAFRR